MDGSAMTYISTVKTLLIERSRITPQILPTTYTYKTVWVPKNLLIRKDHCLKNGERKSTKSKLLPFQKLKCFTMLLVFTSQGQSHSVELHILSITFVTAITYNF